MENLEAVVAVYRDWGIGKDGTQPLVIPEDRKRFRELTQGAAIVVGRRTLEDFPGGKPLPGRVNIVITTRDIEIEGAIVVHSIEELFETIKDMPKVYVAGGAMVYYQLLHHCVKVHLTRIDAKPDTDKLFPNLDNEFNWTLTYEGPDQVYEGTRFSFCEYEIYDVRKDFRKIN
jgi:dihydrofolate reductase